MRHLYHAMHCYLNAPEMPFPSFDDYEEMHGVEFTPSRHSTAAIFLVSFWKRDKLYRNEMSKTTVDKDDGWLCCDHTFASVSEFPTVYHAYKNITRNAQPIGYTK